MNHFLIIHQTPDAYERNSFSDVLVSRYEIKYDKDDYVLRVKKASISDEGTFTCVAENRVGKLEAAASLTVRGMKSYLFAVFFPSHCDIEVME